MASVGPQNPTAATNGAGSRPWGNPTNCYASDDSRAIHTHTFTGASTTNALIASGFDFSAIPSGATIDGIVLDVERSCSNTAGSPRDSSVRLTKDGSTFVGSDKASGTTWPTTDAYTTYGGVADLWGTTWTLAEIQASTFGVAVSAQRDAVKGFVEVRIDHIRITVYYTGGAVGVVGSAVSARSISPGRIFGGSTLC